MGTAIQLKVYNDRVQLWNYGGLPEKHTTDWLLSPHTSIPRNENIANAFYLAGFIEAWGRGIEKMCIACQDYGSPLPSYTLGRYDIMVRFDAAPVVLPFIEEERRKYEISRTPRHNQVTGKVTGKSATILETIKANPRITVDQLMSLLSMSNAGVRKIMRQLK
ncbi:MAG: hypothetical protein J5799_03155, partial [Bacteroidales bacterium]|nr:hypothetical protein [Bacteroidales bacterium]